MRTWRATTAATSAIFCAPSSPRARRAAPRRVNARSASDLAQRARRRPPRRAGAWCSSRCRCRRSGHGVAAADLVMIAARWIQPLPRSSSATCTSPTAPCEAVRGIDFEVARGEVFGLLGPNGAGKTTTVEILEGYRERTSGIVSVLGHDPGGAPARAARARRHRAAVERHLPPRDGARARRALGRASIPRRATSTRSSTSPACASPSTCARGAVGRPGAAPGLRARARRRPRADLPRRADDRLRPGRAARGVGHDPRARRPRQDRPADDALPRRGAGAVRPRRDRQGRAHPRRRRAGRARRRRVLALPRRLARRGRRARQRARPTTRRRCCTS